MNIRQIIDANKKERDAAKKSIEALIEANRLKGPENYGVIFEGYTMARYIPWVGKYKDRMGFGMAEDRMYMIDQFASIVPQGVAVECGVYTGWVTKMLLDMGKFTEVYAFDTFEGIQGAKPGEMFNNGDMSVKDIKQEVFDRIDGAIVVEGKVQDTLNVLLDVNDISFVHLDMDVYEPTLTALECIYPRMVQGGVIVLDDFGNWMTPGIMDAVSDFILSDDVKFVYLPTGQGVIFR